MTAHPTPAELFAGGDAVRAHLAGCPECQRLSDLLSPAPAGPRYVRRGAVHAGGMGRTVRAWDRVLEREVLLKEALAPPELSAHALRRRFVREAKLTAGLAHPSILTVYDLGEGEDGAPFYAMPFVEGRTLAEEIAATAPGSRLELVSRVAAIADAVAYAHSRGVVHRDIKPDNVIVGAFGQVVVIDWGLAARVGGEVPGADGDDPGDGLTARGVGTPAYMAPEQAQGEPADPRQDVYAIGATLYHCLTGAPPWAGRSGRSIRVAHAARAGVRPLGEVAPGTPRELLSLVDRAMAASPDQRFPDAIPLANELRRFLEGALLTSHRYTPWERARRWLWRQRAWVGAGVAAVVAAGSVGAVSLRQLARSRDAALVELARARAAQSALQAKDPHATADALRSAVEAFETTGGPARPESIAALRGALDAGTAARRVPALAGWGPLAKHPGQMLIADPARRAIRIAPGGISSVPLDLGHPVHAAFAPAGDRWLVIDEFGRIHIGGEGPALSLSSEGRRAGWLDADRLFVVGERKAQVLDLAGRTLETYPLSAPMTCVDVVGGRAAVGDRGGAVHARDLDGTWRTYTMASASITAVTLAKDGRGWAGTADGRVLTFEGEEVYRGARHIQALDLGGDCLGVSLTEGPGEIVSVGPDCVSRTVAGNRLGALRPDGGAVLVLDGTRACAVDTATGASLACVAAPPGALGGGFVDQRAAYVIGFDGVLLFDGAPTLAPHDSEIVGLWPGGGSAVWTASRAGAIRHSVLPGGADREVTRLPSGISAAAARGDTLWAGSFDGTWVEVGPSGVRRTAQLRDAVGSILPDPSGSGGWVATLDGLVARYDDPLALGTQWEVPGGVWRLVAVPSGVLTLGLDGAARVWSPAGVAGPVYGGPDDNVGWAEVAADGTVWLRTRVDSVRWDGGVVEQRLAGRLVGQASDGRLVTADPSGGVYVYDANGSLITRWHERRPPRAVSAADTILGDGGEVRALDGSVLRAGAVALVDVVTVGAWQVSGAADGTLGALPDDGVALRDLACDRLAALFSPCSK